MPLHSVYAIDDKTGRITSATFFDGDRELRFIVEPSELIRSELIRVELYVDQELASMYLSIDQLRSIRDLSTRILDDFSRVHEIKLAGHEPL